MAFQVRSVGELNHLSQVGRGRKDFVLRPRNRATARLDMRSLDDNDDRIHGAGIYTNIGGILMGSMLPYIAAPWILWVMMITLLGFAPS